MHTMRNRLLKNKQSNSDEVNRRKRLSTIFQTATRFERLFGIYQMNHLMFPYIWCVENFFELTVQWNKAQRKQASKQIYVLHADTVFEPHTHSWVAHNPIVPKQIWKMDRSDEYVPLEIYLHLSSVPNGLDSPFLVQTFFRPNEKYHNIWTWSENQFYYHYYCYETICVLVGIWL